MNETQEEWFYVQGGKRNGPISFSSLRSLYEAGDVNENTSVWTAKFGDEWTKLETVAGLRSSLEPPIVPTSEIPNHWFYLLIAAPFVMSFVEAGIFETYPALYSEDGFSWLSVGIYFVPNTIFALLDMSALERGGRRDGAHGLLGWALLFVPVYIFLRSKRTRMHIWPLLVWFGALFAGLFVTNGLPANTFLGSDTPKCDSKSSISMIEKLYPDIPLNLTHLKVVDVYNIREVSFNEDSGLRECSATVENSNGMETPVSFSISDLGDGFYYEVGLSGF